MRVSEVKTHLCTLCQDYKHKEAIQLLRSCWDHPSNLDGLISGLDVGLDLYALQRVVSQEPESASQQYAMYQARIANSDAQPYLLRAAALGYPLARYELARQALFSRRPAAQQAAFKTLQELAHMGLLYAYFLLAVAHEDGLGVEPNMVDAGICYARGVGSRDDVDERSSVNLGTRLRLDPRCIPYGRWRPDPAYQRFLPPALKIQLFTWLLVAQRKRICHYLALRVTEYIVTK